MDFAGSLLNYLLAFFTYVFGNKRHIMASVALYPTLGTSVMLDPTLCDHGLFIAYSSLRLGDLPIGLAVDARCLLTDP
jgi:hypothetical protein